MATAVKFSCMFDYLQVCLFQNEQEYARSRELAKMLLKADDELVVNFINALEETQRQHVIRFLLPEGLNTSVVSCLFLYDT